MVTTAHAKANKKWDNKNKDRKNYLTKRSATKGFILNFATEEDLATIEGYIAERKAKLSKEKKHKKIFL